MLAQLVAAGVTEKIAQHLRDLCRCRGGQTFVMTVDEVRRPIAREKDANALLHDESLTSFLPPDDLLFLRYLLVEKVGLNLRNKVAHSLMLPSGYTIDVMHLLVLAVLRLGWFVLRAQSDTGKVCDAADAEQQPQS